MDVVFDIQTIQNKLYTHQYQKLGTGSGRRVYQLDSDYVIKSAYNIKGYAQNQVEAYISETDESEIFAKIFFFDPDYRYLIMKRAERISNISVLFAYFRVNNLKELFALPELNDIILKYNLLIADLRRPVNWGLIDSRPVIIDYGFTKMVKRKYYSFF
ncbi:MAG: hypothetical protein K2H31_11355 [Lachnospiraceae bacterium]|nr:hypothetical protein [Lachnospiraceae bacterium]